jgi:hypothetical protein
MREIRGIVLAAIVLSSAAIAAKIWATPPVQSESSAGKANDENGTNPPPISVSVKVQGGPGQIAVNRAYITAGTNKFAFLIPDDYRLASSDAQAVTLMKADGSALVTIRVINWVANASKPFDGATARQLLTQEHSDAIIAAEFGMSAANAAGPAFEILWGSGVLARASRVGFVPLRAGVIQFSLDASPKNLAPSIADLNSITLTFRASDESGQLEATPIFDRI